MRLAHVCLALLSGAAALLLSACGISDQLLAPPPATRIPVPAVVPTPAKSFPPQGRTQGNPDAKVTLVVYSDFQCPYCRQYWRDVEIRIEEDYIKTGLISYTFKYFPVIDKDRIGESHWAAYAAECANEQGRFWEYQDKLFSEWRGENVGVFTRSNLKAFAAETKLDTAIFNQCLDTDKYANLVLDQLTEAKQLRLPGTPTFLLNGRRMKVETLDYAEFSLPIEAELRSK